ncbi:MAG: cell division protein PerM [Propionibacteriaceae bacterium]
MPSSHNHSPLRLRVSRPGAKKTSSSLLLLGPWWLVAGILSAISAISGWILVVGLTIMGWMSEIQSSFNHAIHIGTQIWLLVHGVTANIAGLKVSLIPLLLTMGVWLLVNGATGVAAKQYKLRYDSSASASATCKVSAAVTLGYVAVSGLIAALLATLEQVLQIAVAAGILSGTASLVAAARSFNYRPWDPWSLKLKIFLRAAKTALGVILLGGTVALLTGFILHWKQVMALASALDMPMMGAVVLVVLHIFYLPTMLLWSSSWVLGGGISLGSSTVVSLVNNHLGLLPGIPVLGILPNNGPASMFMLCWLLVGVLAGIAAARIVARDYPASSVEEVSLASGLTGVLTAVVVVICAALSRGNLGNEQLVALGPRLGELFIMTSGVLGLSAAVAGSVFSLRSHRR